MFRSPKILGVGAALVLMQAGSLAATHAADAAKARSGNATSCPGSTLTPVASSRVAVEDAIACVVNGYRNQRNLSSLHRVGSLRAAARKHGQRMVANGFFGHVGPDGTTLVDRLRTSHYLLPGDAGWEAAEDLAMAGGYLATASHVVAEWMASPTHRANLLRGTIRDLGVGVVPGAPAAIGDEPFTVVIDLGARHR